MKGLLKRIKDLASSFKLFNNYSGLSSSSYSLYPTGDITDNVGIPWENSIIYSAINWISRTFQESNLLVKKIDGEGAFQIVRDHEVLRLLETPNPYYDLTTLWSGTLLSLHTDGNAYWYKCRSESGRVTQLWYVPHFMMEPISSEKSDSFIDAYRYSYNGTELHIPVSDVVHFRNGMLDPYNIRKGISPLSSIIKEICTDNEAALFSTSILKNMGVPGIIITPSKEEVHFSPDNAQKLSMLWKSKFRGENRGEPLVAPLPLKIDTLGWSPEQLVLDKVRRIPEERISSVLGVSPIVLGLGAGLEKSTYNNYKEAREAAYESNILPMQKMLGKQLNNQLLIDFTHDRSYQFFFDTSGVKCLREDANSMFQRIINAYQGGVINRAEARTALGWQTSADDNVFISG